jgi:hypothetical protein
MKGKMLGLLAVGGLAVLFLSKSATAETTQAETYGGGIGSSGLLTTDAPALSPDAGTSKKEASEPSVSYNISFPETKLPAPNFPSLAPSGGSGSAPSTKKAATPSGIVPTTVNNLGFSSAGLVAKAPTSTANATPINQLSNPAGWYGGLGSYMNPSAKKSLWGG